MWLTNINYAWLEHLKAYSFMALGYIRAQLLRNSHSSLLLISFLKSPRMTQTGLLPSLWQFDQSQHVGRQQYWSGGREHDTTKGNLKWQVTGFSGPLMYLVFEEQCTQMSCMVQAALNLWSLMPCWEAHGKMTFTQGPLNQSLENAVCQKHGLVLVCAL